MLCGDDSLQPDDCTIQREAVAAVFIGGVECDERAVGIVHGAGVGLRIGMGHHVVAQHGGRVARGIGADGVQLVPFADCSMTIVVTPMLVMEKPEPVVVLIEIEFVPLLAINASERLM